MQDIIMLNVHKIRSISELFHSFVLSLKLDEYFIPSTHLSLG